MSTPDDQKYDVELGPLFTAGVVLLGYGFLRRRPLAVAAGLGAIWLDQRSEFGRALKKRVRSAAKAQIKARARPDAADVDRTNEVDQSDQR
jgi:hypothetical protein